MIHEQKILTIQFKINAECMEKPFIKNIINKKANYEKMGL